MDNPVGRTVIGVGANFSGKIKDADSIEINGSVKADLNAEKVTIGEDGDYEGSIKADLVVVSGGYNGNMDVGSVWATATARISGKIQYKTLQMDRGAALNCRVIHNWTDTESSVEETDDKYEEFANEHEEDLASENN